MSSNTELEQDGKEVQAHDDAHKLVKDLVEATGESFFFVSLRMFMRLGRT